MRFVVYDLESFSNYFTATTLELIPRDPTAISWRDMEDGDLRVFTHENLEELSSYLNQEETYLIGFNNFEYDDVILKAICCGLATDAESINKISNRIVKNSEGQIFGSELWKLKYSSNEGQAKFLWIAVDLFKVDVANTAVPSGKLPDGRNKMRPSISLKDKQRIIKWPNLKEYEGDFEKPIPEEDIPALLEYNENDVRSTRALLSQDRNDIIGKEMDLRSAMLDGYPLRIRTSAFRKNGAGFGEEILLNRYTKLTGQTKREIRSKEKRDYLFNANEMIFPFIRFNRPEHQIIIDNIRTIKPCSVVGGDEGQGCELARQIDKINPKFVFDTMTITMKLGGVHGADQDPKIVRGDIVMYDVSSYYPMFYLFIGRAPDELLDSFLDLYADSIATRLKVKGHDKAQADSLKLQLNAVYGKGNSKFSFLYDPIIARAIVINGQLMLTMLAEQLEDAGCTLLDVNTDGVLVKTTDRDRSNEIVKKWCSLIEYPDKYDPVIRFTADPVSYRIYAGFAVSNYALYDGKEWSVRKGAVLGNPSLINPSIISEAVLKNVSDGVSPIATVKQCTDPYAFCRKLTARGLTEGDGKLQKNNRVYHSTDIEKAIVKIVGKRRERVTETGNALNLRSMNVVDQLPTDIDYVVYSDKADRLIKELNGDLVVKKEDKRLSFTEMPTVRSGMWVCNLISWADIADRLSTPIEVDDYSAASKENQRAFNLCKYADGSSNRSAENIKAVHGLILDYDNSQLIGQTTIEEVEEQLQKYEYLLYTSISHKRKKWIDGELVDQGFYDASHIDRFRVVIPFLTPMRANSWDSYRKAMKKFAAGFAADESFTLGQSFFWYSIVDHPGYLYHNKGVYLDWHDFRRDTTVKKKRKAKTIKKDGKTIDSNYLNKGDFAIETLDLVRFLKDKGLEPNVVDGPSWRNTAKCIWHQDGNEHSDGTDTMSFRLEDRDAGFQWMVKCQHGSHGGYVSQPSSKDFIRFVEDKWGYEEFRPYCDLVENIPVPDTVEAESDSSAVRALAVSGPTGVGKTENIVREAIHYLRDTEDNVLIVVGNKEQQKVVGERFAKLLETDNIGSFGIDIVEAEEKIRIGEYTSQDHYRDKTRVLIIHTTYMKRRGFSLEYYAAMKFIEEKNPHIRIDEADLYIEQLVESHSLGGRYKGLLDGQDNPVGQYTDNCLIRRRAGNCAQCFMRKYAHYNAEGSYMVPVWGTEFTLRKGKTVTDHTHIPIEDWTTETVAVGNDEIAFLKQNDNLSVSTLLFTEIENRRVFSEHQVFEDMLESSFCPTIHTYRPVVDGELVDADYVRENLIDYSGGKRKLSIPDGVQFSAPKMACGVRRLVFLDRRPLMYMSNHAKSVKLYTATLSEFDKKFIQSCIPDAEFEQMEVPGERKIDNITIIAWAGIADTSDEWWDTWESVKPGKFIYFAETEERARIIHSAVKMKDLSVPFSKNSDTHEHKVEQASEEIDGSISYVRSAIGRGRDYPDRQIAVVSARAYKPVCAFPTDDKDELITQIAEDRIKNVVQPAGRILRKFDDGKQTTRVIVVYGIESNNEGDIIVEKVRPMGANVEYALIPSWVPQADVVHLIKQSHQLGQLPALVPNGVDWVCRKIEVLADQGETMTKIKKAIHMASLESTLDPGDLMLVEQTLDRADVKKKKWAYLIEDMVSQGHTSNDIKQRLSYSKKSGDDKMWIDDIIDRVVYKDVI